jgi:putative SOS response-associated peptidase YedK
MPAFLDPDSYDLWLDPAMTNMAAASDLLKPLAGATPTEPMSESLVIPESYWGSSPLAG